MGLLFFALIFLVIITVIPTVQRIKLCGVAVQLVVHDAAVLQVLTFPEEKLIVFKEHRNNWYRFGAYFSARMMAELPFQMWVVVAAAKPASLPPTCACVRRILPLVFCLEVYWYACAWPWRRAGRRMTRFARRIPGLGTGRRASHPSRSEEHDWRAHAEWWRFGMIYLLMFLQVEPQQPLSRCP